MNQCVTDFLITSQHYGNRDLYRATGPYYVVSSGAVGMTQSMPTGPMPIQLHEQGGRRDRFVFSLREINSSARSEQVAVRPTDPYV